MRAAACMGLLLLATGCDAFGGDEGGFPPADRPVSDIVAAQFRDEESRDRVNEADSVMEMAAIEPGMTVADIGAGNGYYTIRLARRVGDSGRVLAEDVIAETRDRLADRVTRERLDNVSVRLGEFSDPKLPENSFDRIFMVHMYHEIESPYEFLWNMRPALRDGGRVVVVDANRPTNRHGTPPDLLNCEFEAVGYRRVSYTPMPQIGGYLAMFVREGERPEPGDIVACGQD
ncbi:class I SAM-dependent methyltransferase [Parasphingopyxis marina]|uniref:Class I SAM-dependent methyltransferase n=1 Tax=Parasphingopyxis marina TaxID=2761622 RepID=A0A842I055_9SPHN|nr:methyltransferase domain-containing protein [Parasphingopyxis marina]MBC2778515.1 class I SAM-dependent methyltransferase [Parasphingopyxis marina]